MRDRGKLIPYSILGVFHSVVLVEPRRFLVPLNPIWIQLSRKKEPHAC
jgi:hypothetical protein